MLDGLGLAAVGDLRLLEDHNFGLEWSTVNLKRGDKLVIAR